MINDIIKQPGSDATLANGPRRRSKGPELRVFGRHKRVALIVALLIVVALAASGLTWRHFSQSRNLNDVTTIERLVGQHYLLPSGEIPTLATVTDKSKLQTPFLRKADNQDKILIYEKAGVVMIYRPSIDRIIAVGPVQIQPLKTNK